MVALVVRPSDRRIVAVDTSSLQRYLAGEQEPDTELVRAAFADGALVLPPPVLAEALSDPALTLENSRRIRSLPLLDIKPGYWERTGMLRGFLRRDGYKAWLPDCLVAQCCIDWAIPLIVADRDFRHFIRLGLVIRGQS